MPSETLRFGEFELDVAGYQLRREGRTVRLERLPMDLLLMLVGRRGQLVSREEIVEKLWGKDVFVDADTSVNTAVRKIRLALRDDPDQPAYVQTVTGKGYRFVAPVIAADGEARVSGGEAGVSGPADEAIAAAQVSASPEQAALLGRASAPRSGLRGWPFLLATVACAGAAAVWLVGRPAHAPREVTRFTVALAPGMALEYVPLGTSIAASPDGRRVALVASGAGRPPQLWIRTLDALSARPVEGTEYAFSPFWSLDGRFVAYFSEGKLRKVPAEGGPPEVLSDVESVNSGSWGADGTILFSQHRGLQAGLWRISAFGGAPAKVHTDAGATESWPQILPDGRHFLFVTGAYGGPDVQTHLHVGSLDSTHSQRLLRVDSRATYVAGGRIVFVRDGALVAAPFDAGAQAVSGEGSRVGDTVSYVRSTGSALYSASADGRLLVYVPAEPPTLLTWLDRTGRSLGTVGDPARIFAVRLAPDGRRVAFHIRDVRQGTRDVWIDDLERGLRGRLTTDPQNGGYPVWGPGGERLAFSSGRSGASGDLPAPFRAGRG